MKTTASAMPVLRAIYIRALVARIGDRGTTDKMVEHMECTEHSERAVPLRVQR
jgi:hypothetical protein